MRKEFILSNQAVKAGDRQIIEIPISRLSDHTPVSLSTYVIHGRKDGPVMFVSAAIHGDEIIGVEIIRRLVSLSMLKRIRGTLILIPVVNAYGFVGLSRYLPDRRDLNRSFPGNAKGSLASQLAYTFMTEIVAPAQYGIDLHSGAVHRANLPQIRADLEDPDVNAMARAFGASIMLDANLRDGSLRASAKDNGCKILLYEAGEALRFDEVSVRVGVNGVLRVLRHVGMLQARKSAGRVLVPIRSNSSHWLRAPMGGLMRAKKKLGDRVEADEIVALISDPLGFEEHSVVAPAAGVVIGRTNLPVVNRGDAVLHIAKVRNVMKAEQTVGLVETQADEDPLFDDEIIV